MRTRGALALALLISACSTPAPPTLAASVSCAPESRSLRQLCTVTLTDRSTGRRLEGATVTLSADMPSMPLAHSVRPVTATARGGGAYSGVLELEMTGRWVITTRVTGPVSDQITHTLEIQ